MLRFPYTAGADRTVQSDAAAIRAVQISGRYAHDATPALVDLTITGMFALGILLMSTVRSFREFSHMLFGNILGVTQQDLIFIAGVAVVVLLLLALFHKELELASVDSNYALAIGLPVNGLRYLLLGMLAFTVVSAIQAVGVVLTSALLVTPAAAASLLTHRLIPMMVIAALIATASGVAGLYASYYASHSSGAAILLVCTLVFVVVWLLRR